MKFNLISIVYLLGALQAFVLLVGINIRQPLQTDLKKIMTSLLATLVVLMVYYIVVITQHWPLYPYVDSLGTAAWLALCPLYYLLCRSLSEANWRLSARHFLLFPVTLIFLIEAAVTTFGGAPSLYDLVHQPQLFLDLWIAVFFGSSLLFTTLSIRLLHKSNSNRFRQELRWFSYILWFFLAVFLVIYLFIRTTYHYAFEYALIALFEGFIFFFIYRLFRLTSFNTLFQAAKYHNEALNSSQLTQLAQQLEQLMQQEQPHLNKKLTLAQLAELSKVSSNDLSQLFATHYASNFYDFVKKYRLLQLEQLLLDPDHRQYTIPALAEMSGFNSKATFYKAFKEKHQLTPSEYIKQRENGL